jgi:NAD(P)-dependent dehydrogenase (short-subunit alcohol dehydrogenase family)
LDSPHAHTLSPDLYYSLKGIGRATTLALADLGAEVIAVSRTGVDELAKEVRITIRQEFCRSFSV